MHGTIKIKLSELNVGFIEHIKSLLQGDEDRELTLSFDDSRQQYFETLSRSKKELEAGQNLTTFTMEELEEYTRSKRP
jgi:hypothetical protein